MVALYLFCFGLGGVLLAASFFADAEGVDDLGDSGWQQLFSLRNLTYFLFVFGAVGAAIAFLKEGKPGITTLLIAGTAGLVMAGLAHYVFGYVRRTDTSEVAPDSSLVGQAARVTLPVGAAGIGKVELTVGGQRVELLARPFGTERGEAAELENGSEVVIVEMVGGTAFVSRASMDE